MTRGKKKKILSYSERQGLEDQKRDAEALKREAESPGRTREINLGAVDAEIKHLDKELHDGRAPKVSGARKDNLHKKAKELEGRIKEGMPTRAEMDHPGRNPGSVRKHMNWDKRNKDNIREYKEIMRHLEPEAPVNLEALRRKQ